MNATLTKPSTKEETCYSLKDLPSERAPRLDGLSSDLYAKLWEKIGDGLLEVFNEALNQGVLCRDLNTTILCLLPKGQVI